MGPLVTMLATPCFKLLSFAITVEMKRSFVYGKCEWSGPMHFCLPGWVHGEISSGRRGDVRGGLLHSPQAEMPGCLPPKRLFSPSPFSLSAARIRFSQLCFLPSSLLPSDFYSSSFPSPTSLSVSHSSICWVFSSWVIPSCHTGKMLSLARSVNLRNSEMGEICSPGRASSVCYSIYDLPVNKL